MRVINKAIYLLGFGVLIVSWVQWFFRYEDLSQLFLGTGISLSIFAFAYILSWMDKTSKDIKDLEKRIEGIIKIYTREEIE